MELHKKNVELVRRQYELWNERKFEKAFEDVHENATFSTVPFGTQTNGKEAYLDLCQGWVTAFPDGKVEVKRVLATEDFAICEIVGKGTHRGPFSGPSGTEIPPTGKYVTLEMCDLYEFKGGKISAIRTYFDFATILRRIGLLPAIGVRKEAEARPEL